MITIAVVGIDHPCRDITLDQLALLAAMRGAPLKAIQDLLGHATIQMTMRYAHLAPEVARDAVRLLDTGDPFTAAPPRCCATNRWRTTAGCCF